MHQGTSGLASRLRRAPAWRWVALVAASLGIAVFGAAALAAGQTPAGPSAPAGPVHDVSYLPDVTPRSVTPPRNGGLSHPEDEAEEEQEDVPAYMEGGTAATGVPAVVGDPRAASTVSAPSAKAPLLAPNALAANGSFGLLNAFTGATLATSGCCQPPDTQMAVGRNEVVEAVNNNIYVFDRGGTQTATYPASDVFQPAGQNVGLTDPKIVFDPSAGASGLYYMTFMVCQNAGCGANNFTHMGISLAVSSNGLNWTVYDYLNDGQNLQDQEKLGFSGDKITFAVNEYNCKCGAGTSFLQVNVVVLQKSDVVAGNTIAPVINSANSFASFIFDSIPTIPVNASTADNTQYVVWDRNATTNNEMAVIRITGTPNANNVNFGNVQKVPISNQTAPPTPVQPSGTIAGDKQNLQSAMVQGNQLWAVATDGCTPAGDTAARACTRLLEVNLAGGNSTLLYDTNIGTKSTYRYNPSVMKDATDHVYFGFTISSATDFATAALDAGALPPPATFGRLNFGAGDATYTGSRWGDYSATAQDPRNTNDVWSAQEFGACAAACSSGGGNWATAIGQFTFKDPSISSVSPDHGPATGGTQVDILGNEFANGGTSVSFGGTPAQSVTWVDSTHIRAVSPAHDSGTVDITATTSTGTSDVTNADRYTYNPVLTSVSPDNGPAAGGQSVTITGAGLNGATAVSFGGTPAASFTVVSSSTITATTPAHAGGTVNLTVTTAGGGLSNAIQYTFRIPTVLTYDGATTQDFHDTAVLSATLTSQENGSPVAGKTVSFTMASESCSATTNAAGKASCSIIPTEAAGTYTVAATFAGDTKYEKSAISRPFVVTLEETTLSYDGPANIANGYPATMRATLLEDGTTPIAGRTVKLTLGSGATAQSCSATTDSGGHASCTITTVNQPATATTVAGRAEFLADAYYLPSSATATIRLLYYTGRAYGLSQQLLFLPGSTVSDTGSISTSGSSSTSNTALRVNALPLVSVVTANGLNASVTTGAGQSVAQARTTDATIGIAGVPVIRATDVRATSTSTCAIPSFTAARSGSSTLGTLSIAGVPQLTASFAPNSVIRVGTTTITINEQVPVAGASAGLTVNALHVVAPGIADVIVSSARSDIHNCP